jgi:hypothetical protein
MPYKQTKKYIIPYFAPNLSLGPDVGASQEKRAAEIVDTQLGGMIKINTNKTKATVKIDTFNNLKNIGTFTDISGSGSGTSIMLQGFSAVLDGTLLSPDLIIWNIAGADISQDLFLGIRSVEKDNELTGEIESTVQASTVEAVMHTNTSDPNTLWLVKRKAGLGLNLETLTSILDVVAVHENDAQNPHGPTLQVGKLVINGGLDFFDAFGVSGIEIVIDVPDAILSSGIDVTLSTNEGLVVLSDMTVSGTLAVDTLQVGAHQVQSKLTTSGVSEIFFNTLTGDQVQIDSLVITSGLGKSATVRNLTVSGTDTVQDITLPRPVITQSGVAIDGVQFSTLKPLVGGGVTLLHYHDKYANRKRISKAPPYHPVAIQGQTGSLDPEDSDILMRLAGRNIYRLTQFADLVTMMQPPLKENVTSLRNLRTFVHSLSGVNTLTVYRADGTEYTKQTLSNTKGWSRSDVDLRSGFGIIDDRVMVRVTASGLTVLDVGEMVLEWE